MKGFTLTKLNICNFSCPTKPQIAKGRVVTYISIMVFFLIGLLTLAPLQASGEKGGTLGLSKAHHSVWRIYTKNQNLNGEITVATAFSIGRNERNGRNLFITNFHTFQHILENGHSVSDIQLSQSENHKKLSFHRVLYLSNTYDLAIFETKEKVPNYLSFADKFISNEFDSVSNGLILIGYPHNEFKKMKVTSNAVYEDSFYYIFTTDADPKSEVLAGASGGPVLNKNGEVVGVMVRALKQISYAIKLDHIKGFISGQLGSTQSAQLDFTQSAQLDFTNCIQFILLDDCLDKEIDNTYRMARDGNPLSQFRLAEPSNQVLGVEEKANWLIKSAKSGFPPAAHDLAWLYYKGEGVPKNVFQMARLLEAGAIQGFFRAQHDFGRILYFGIGVNRDEELALEWVRKAREWGYFEAQDFLDFPEKRGK